MSSQYSKTGEEIRKTKFFLKGYNSIKIVAAFRGMHVSPAKHSEECMCRLRNIAMGV